MKVLLIEDSLEIINTITLTLKLRWPEATLLTTTEGLKGVELVRSDPPDIVILDVNLPDIDGFEVLKRIRSFSQIPVIMLTVRDEWKDRLKGREMGANDYIIKPFSAPDLLFRMKLLVKRGVGPKNND